MRRYIKKSVMIILLLATPLVSYLWHYHALSKRLMTEHAINGEQANAFKHAYAAAQLFQVLDSFLPDDNAERTVLWLGHMNEHAEQWMRAYPEKRSAGHQPDTTSEIIKDLHNNRVGIAVAKWQAQHTPQGVSSLEIILRLTETDALVIWADKVGIAQSELDNHLRDVAFAHAWVEQRREEITARTTNTLQKLY